MEDAWVYILSASSFLFLLFLFKLQRSGKRNLPPGPPSLPIIGHLLLIKEPVHRTLQSLSDRYGPVLSLSFGSRPVVVVSSPSAAEECFTRNDVILANRPSMLAGQVMAYGNTTIGTAPYGMIDEHRSRRKRNDANGGREDESKTMIDTMLSEGYADDIIKGQINSMSSAGTDTSAVTIEWAMSLLLNHPDVMKKAQAELDDVVGRDRLVDEVDTHKLPYLHNIINEALRLFPPGPLLVPHESAEDCTVSGFDVPRGTMILVNVWAIQRDPKVWDDPTSFKPERYEGLEGDHAYRLLPFGMGRRSCPGAGLANRVVSLALAVLIQCLEWKRVSEEPMDLSEGTGLTMPKREPLEAMCKA
ncbi:hypothetical protein EUGRSUZ_L01095, partial [Eucalyptus grandis]